MEDEYYCHASVAIRFPDGTLLPVWDGADAKIRIAQMDCAGVPEIVIERLIVRKNGYAH